jgi:hypothetical protein
MRRTWGPPFGPHGNSTDKNCSGRACGKQVRGTAPAGSPRPRLAATTRPPGLPASAREKLAWRSSSTQSASSLRAGGSSCVGTVAAMRNLAGRRFSATSRYHDSAPRIAGSSQIVRLAKSPTGRLLGSIYILRRRRRPSPAHICKYLPPLSRLSADGRQLLPRRAPVVWLPPPGCAPHDRHITI